MAAIRAQNQLCCWNNSLNDPKLSLSGSDNDSDNYMDYVLTDTVVNKDGNGVATFYEIFSSNFWKYLFSLSKLHSQAIMNFTTPNN